MQNDMSDRLVDLIKEAHTKWSYSIGDFESVCADHLIENGVVSVVRCKDCKHLMFSDCYGECSRGYMGIVSPNDYCSYGERKCKQ